MDENYIRKKMKFLLNDRGITISQFADGINVSRYVVYHWFNQNSKSFMPLLGNIATYFNVSMDYLTGNATAPDVEREAGECLAELKSRSELRELFMSAKDASKSDIEAATQMIEALKRRKE